MNEPRANRILLDSNVPIYAYDTSDLVRRRRARDVLIRAGQGRVGVISTQVLAEFYVNVTRRIPNRLAPARAETALRLLCRIFVVLPVTPDMVCRAARACREYQLSFWDAQVWAAAKIAGTETILSEDVPGQSLIEGVQWVNPFTLSNAEVRALVPGRRDS